MVPSPKPLPSHAHGEGKIRLSVDPTTGLIEVRVNSSWFTPDGEGHESYFGLEGDRADAWELINEAATWLWKRWKRPLSAVGPFDA